MRPGNFELATDPAFRTHLALVLPPALATVTGVDGSAYTIRFGEVDAAPAVALQGVAPAVDERVLVVFTRQDAYSGVIVGVVAG